MKKHSRQDFEMMCDNVTQACKNRICSENCEHFTKYKLTLEKASKMTSLPLNTLLSWIHRGHQDRVLSAISQALPLNFVDKVVPEFIGANLYLIKKGESEDDLQD